MPLPLGTWIITSGGAPGSMTVAADGMGGFNGTVFGQPLVGFFEEATRTFTFMQVKKPDVSAFDIYKGTLFQFSPSIGTVIFTLAGEGESDPAAGSPSRFSWFAQQSQKLKEKEKEANKENKDGKDTKDRKENKENKESKDLDDKFSLKERGKELEQLPNLAATDVQSMMGMLTQRVSDLEQRMATGQAFITPAERPSVGDQALYVPDQQPEPVE